MFVLSVFKCSSQNTRFRRDFPRPPGEWRLRRPFENPPPSAVVKDNGKIINLGRQGRPIFGAPGAAASAAFGGDKKKKIGAPFRGRLRRPKWF